MNYKFVPNFDEEPKEHLTSFYQAASFANPQNGAYHVRRFIVNNNNEFINIRDHHLNKKQYHKLLERKKPNEYKVYSVYDLKNVNYPSFGDVLAAKSSILATDYNYYGAAPF
jgi:hypothetical protein